jgi:hypothetical protein
MKLIKWGTLFCALAALQAVPQTAQNARLYLKEARISQTAGIVHIQADSPRPLAQILDALRQKYGWAVDYEDPQYISSIDLVPTPGGNSQSQLPAGGSFSVELPATSPDEEKILRLVVDSYNHSNNPGRFDVRRNASGNFAVVGISAHDQKGALSPQPILFDLPLTVTSEERTITETVNLVCQEITAQSHIAVTVGVSPRSLLDRNTVKLGGAKVQARDLLSQSLTATHHTLYWRLFFDPDSKGYFLSIHSTAP